MKKSRRNIAAALAAAVVLASGAFAIGSQAGDGQAAAANGQSGQERTAGGPFGRGGHHGPGASDLAEQLGVSEARLRAAFEKLRDEAPTPQEREKQLAADLAERLDVDADAVSAALAAERREAVAEHRQRHAEFRRRLAEELGISTEKLDEALPAPPEGGRRGGHGPGHGPGFGPFGGRP